MQLFTIHATVEQLLVEPTVVIPLTQVELILDPCDKEELCNHASLISMPQLVNDHVISIFANNSHAE